MSELTGPVYGHEAVREGDGDLTKQHTGEPLGERIIVHGRVVDEDGRGVADTLVEIWQANACGRYTHVNDQHPAPLDPNFQGFATLRTDAKGDWRIITVKPAGYDSPIGNRPPHIHFDLRSDKTRNVAQMYFPEDAEGNAKDLLYKALKAEDAATSLAARNAADPNKYVWDVVMLA